MKWFARGRLWDSMEQEHEDFQRIKIQEKRGRDWRPGGAHKDPRARFDKEKRRRDKREERSHRDQQRQPGNQSFRPRSEPPSTPPAGRDRPWTTRPRTKDWRSAGRAERQGPAGRPDHRDGNRPWSKPRSERPRSAQPRSDRPWAGKPHGDRAWSGKPREDRTDKQRNGRSGSGKPPTERPWSGKPQRDRPWSGKVGGDRPWSAKPRGNRPSSETPGDDRRWSGKGQGNRPWRPKPNQGERRPPQSARDPKGDDRPKKRDEE